MTSFARRTVLFTGLAIAVIVGSWLWVRYESPRNATDLVVAIVGTLFGTALGVPVGLYLDHTRQQEDVARERRRRQRDRLEHQKLTAAFLKEEMIHNGTTLLQLNETLGTAPADRSDTWTWARTVVEALEFDAYRQLRSVPRRVQPQDDGEESLHMFYRNLKRLKHRVRQAEAGRTLIFGAGANQRSADEEKRSVLTSVNITRQQLQYALTHCKDLVDADERSVAV